MADHEIEELKVWLSLSQQSFVLTCFIRVGSKSNLSRPGTGAGFHWGKLTKYTSGSEGILL